MDFTIPPELDALAKEIRAYVDERLEPITRFT